MGGRDIRGGPQFTHTSWDDYRVLESQLVGDGSRTTKRIVPYGVFTDPQLGRVGNTEEEARAEGAELVHLYITLMNAHAPYTVMRDALHIHPTLSEAVQSAVAELG